MAFDERLTAVEAVDTTIHRWVVHLSRTIPEAQAVLLRGSYARGDAGPWSDIDLDVLTGIDDEDRYLAYLESVDDPAPDGPAQRHISVAVRGVTGWLTDERGPAHWSFGLAVESVCNLRWCPNQELRRELDQPVRSSPPSLPGLEDAIEALGKLRNAHRSGDDLGMRLASRTVAEECPGLLQLVNPLVRPRFRREALDMALAFAVAPPGYRDDLLACLGLVSVLPSPDALLAAGHRLINGIVDLLSANEASLDGRIEDDLLGHLRAGRLQQLVGRFTG